MVGDLTVAQNIFIGREFKKGIMIDDKKMIEESRKLFDELSEAGFGSCKVSVCRELTKKYEQAIRMSVDELRDNSAAVGCVGKRLTSFDMPFARHLISPLKTSSSDGGRRTWNGCACDQQRRRSQEFHGRCGSGRREGP